jgi:subtilisin-like proprotein convertase family protein
VTCYTNSDPMLDVFAPSEFLRAAAANAQTLEFGGTSGAAAYVTGALALLRQADPGLDPMGARMMMRLLGEQVLDDRNGLVRPLIRLDRVMTSGTGVASSERAEAIGEGEDDRALSTIMMDGQGTVGSVRVVLHIVHPDPEELRVTLTAPDGAKVILHDHAAGTFIDPDGSTRFGGIWGSYPDEIEPYDSLGKLEGSTQFGAWTLEVVDDVVTDPPAAARLVGWALRITPRAPPSPVSPHVVTLPVVAHQDGAHETTWISDLRVFNPSPTNAVEARLYFVPHDCDGSATFYQSELLVPAKSIVELPDVVERRFDRDQTQGALRIETDGPELLVTSRIYTGDSTTGTFGQFVGTVDPEHTAIEGDPPLLLLHLACDDAFRTNIGFSELSGSEVAVRVARFDGGTGAPLGSPTRHIVKPFSNLQIRAPSGSDTANMYAVVTAVSGGGRVAAYASVIDNRTGDAIFIPGKRFDSTNQLILPVVARNSGHGDTRWRTELRLSNAEQHPVDLTLELRRRLGDGETVDTRVLSIDGRRVNLNSDIVSDLFGLDRIVGSLRVLKDGPPAMLAATSRTFNLTEGGTYGQYIPGVMDGVGPRATIIHADGTAELRTNLGLCEVAGEPVQLWCSLVDDIGRPLAEPILLSLEPYRLLQIDDIFNHVGAAPRKTVRIDLVLEGGGGDFVGYASVVDANTGDAIYVPAQTVTP